MCVCDVRLFDGENLMKKPSDRLTLIAKDASDDQKLVRATAQIFSRPMDSLLAGVIATIDSLSAGDNTIVERTGGCNKFAHPYPISSQSWGNKLNGGRYDRFFSGQALPNFEFGRRRG